MIHDQLRALARPPAHRAPIARHARPRVRRRVPARQLRLAFIVSAVVLPMLTGALVKPVAATADQGLAVRAVVAPTPPAPAAMDPAPVTPAPTTPTPTTPAATTPARTTPLATMPGATVDDGPGARRPAASTCFTTTPGWTRAENKRAGAPAPTWRSRWNSPAMYLNRADATCADTVIGYASVPTGKYRVQLWRHGYYGGAGARLVKRFPAVALTSQRSAAAASRGGSPAWTASFRFSVPRNAPPGLYTVALVRVGSKIPVTATTLTVQDAAGPSGTVFVVSTLTQMAYSDYGGRSAYRMFRPSTEPGTPRDQRAQVVAFRRPITGPGARSGRVYQWPLVKAVESAGVDVDYVSDLWLDANPRGLATDPASAGGVRQVVVGSHSEYATAAMRDAYEDARDAGVNLAFFGGNQLYWQVRVNRSPAGAPTEMVIHRYAAQEKYAAYPRLATLHFRDRQVGRPESALIGNQYTSLGVELPLAITSSTPWLRWKVGTVVPSGLLSEVDDVTRHSPANVQILGQGFAVLKGRTRPVTGAATYYSSPSGAGVFATGSVCTGDMAWGGTCKVKRAPTDRVSAQFWRRTVQRTVREFDTAFAGARYPSVPTPKLTPKQLLARFGAEVAGRAIGSDGD